MGLPNHRTAMLSRPSGRLVLLSASLWFMTLVSCGLDMEVTAPRPVELGGITFAANPNMVTAATARIECGGAVSAIRVAYRTDGLDSGSTPLVPVATCPASVDILGLLSASTYHTRITAWGLGSDSAAAAGPDLVTDTLPSDFPQITAHNTGAPPAGLTVFSVLDSASLLTKGTVMIVDATGRVRWYLRVNRLLTDLQPQPGGRYTLSLTSFDPLTTRTLLYFDSEYQELDVAGRLLRKWTATGGYFTDNHDIRFTSRGTAVLMGFDFRIMDLTAYGGSPNAQVLGNVIEEIDSV